jgi:hypothetical protein
LSSETIFPIDRSSQRRTLRTMAMTLASAVALVIGERWRAGRGVVNFKDLPDGSAKSGLLSDCRWGFVAPVLAAISCVMPCFLRKTQFLVNFDLSQSKPVNIDLSQSKSHGGSIMPRRRVHHPSARRRRRNRHARRCGRRQKPPQFLKRGDVVELDGGILGSRRQRVV